MVAPVIIIGAGQGGLQAAESLRSHGFTGDILLLGNESSAPYNRPPLSKGLLLGETTIEQLVIRQPAVFDKKQITLRLNVEVVNVDTAAQRVYLANGEQLAYGALIFATGATPRAIPVENADALGIHNLRTLEDTLAIKESLLATEHLVIVGGGFIGLEMAAVARKLGKPVTVVEYADRLMARVVSPPISDFYQALHTEHGCQVLLQTGVTGFEKDSNGQVMSVVLNNGNKLEADAVVLGIGVVPNTSLAEQAGVACENGIVTDRSGKTSIPGIYAIGDCAVQRLENGTLLRLESVQNAVEMAKAAAADICGESKPFKAAPWFWSDQYDIKLQMVGLSAGYDTAVLRGDVAGSSFSYFYFKAGRLCAVDSVNAAADHMIARKLLNAGSAVTAEQAADTGFDLKTLL